MTAFFSLVASPEADLPAGLAERHAVVVDDKVRGLVTRPRTTRHPHQPWSWLVLAEGAADFRAGHAASLSHAEDLVGTALCYLDLTMTEGIAP